MRTHALPFPCPAAAHLARTETEALAGQVRQLIAVARGFVAAGRRVDVAGLDRAVGLLCAKTLDLDTEEGRAARPGLESILLELDALSAAMRTGNP